MGSEIKNSVVDLGDLSKPANTLIVKVSSAVGGLFSPYQIKRVAKAEAAAAIIKAEADIKITDLHRRAMHRFVEEEARKQQSIEDITAQAIPYLSETSKAEDIDNDWMTNFFDKSRIVSDVDMQSLWAQVLAGEANSPGAYSKRTVNALASLDKIDAELFSKLCGCVWKHRSAVPLVFDVDHEIYRSHGLDYNALSHLESIGLVHFDHSGGFVIRGVPKETEVTYFDERLTLTLPKEEKNELDVGTVRFTQVGNELATVCVSQPVEGLMEYVRSKWSDYLD